MELASWSHSNFEGLLASIVTIAIAADAAVVVRLWPAVQRSASTTLALCHNYSKTAAATYTHLTLAGVVAVQFLIHCLPSLVTYLMR